jgi:hypothetical protein
MSTLVRRIKKRKVNYDDDEVDTNAVSAFDDDDADFDFVKEASSPSAAVAILSSPGKPGGKKQLDLSQILLNVNNPPPPSGSKSNRNSFVNEAVEEKKLTPLMSSIKDAILHSVAEHEDTATVQPVEVLETSHGIAVASDDVPAPPPPPPPPPAAPVHKKNASAELEQKEKVQVEVEVGEKKTEVVKVDEKIEDLKVEEKEEQKEIVLDLNDGETPAEEETYEGPLSSKLAWIPNGEHAWLPAKIIQIEEDVGIFQVIHGDVRIFITFDWFNLDFVSGCHFERKRIAGHQRCSLFQHCNVIFEEFANLRFFALDRRLSKPYFIS